MGAVEGKDLRRHPVFRLPTSSSTEKPGRKLLCITFALAATWGGFVNVGGAAEPAAVVYYNLDIPRQRLDVALKDLARQTGLQIVRFSDVIGGDAMVGPLNGTYSVEQALGELLQPTGLSYRPLNERAYIVVAPQESSQETGAEASAPDSPSLPLARTEKGGSLENAPLSEAAVALEEIMVTAQKVEERLGDIPMSVTAMTARYLQTLGATQLLDFANLIPSLSFTSNGIGQTQVNLRGITSGFNVSPTVGIYVDEVPYGSSTAFAESARLALDVALFDMNRIEVLRGPQGTLYGASTMGGLLKYVTNVPEPSAFSGTMRANVASTQHGGVSYDGSSAINVPLVQGEAALRVNGFFMHNGGFVDNLIANEEDVDRADVYGGRVDLLLEPSDRLSVRLTAFLQDIERDGSIATDVDRLTGNPVDQEMQQRRLVDEPFEQRFRLASATVKYELGVTTLTSISSYQTVRSNSLVDFSRLYLPLLGGPDELSAIGLIKNAGTDKLTQELRLSATGERFDWLAGAFYTYEDSDQFQKLLAYAPDGALASVNFLSLSWPSHYEEYAGFGSLTLHVTDKLDVSGGIRYAHNSQGQEQIGSGELIESFPKRSSSDSVATHLANVRYRASESFTSYLRFATGYRPGGPNALVNDLNGRPLAPPTFRADKLTSYEAGLKLQSDGRRVNAALAIFRIDWDNMQIAAIRSGLGVIANATKARSRGAELTVTAMPARGLTIAGAFGYTDAELTQDAPDLGGVRGESLPDAPEVTAALTADYRFGLASYEAFAGTTVRYVDDRNSSFDRSPGVPQYRLPAYATIDVRVGIDLGSSRVQLYCKNVTDEWGQLSASTGQWRPGGSIDVSAMQPRTFGLSVDMSF